MDLAAQILHIDVWPDFLCDSLLYGVRKVNRFIPAHPMFPTFESPPVHAIDARIFAEAPPDRFLPRSGHPPSVSAPQQCRRAARTHRPSASTTS